MNLPPQFKNGDALLNLNKVYSISTAASSFVKKCTGVVQEITEEDLHFIRIRTKTNEIMISYETDFILIVIQNPSSNN